MCFNVLIIGFPGIIHFQLNLVRFKDQNLGQSGSHVQENSNQSGIFIMFSHILPEKYSEKKRNGS